MIDDHDNDTKRHWKCDDFLMTVWPLPLMKLPLAAQQSVLLNEELEHLISEACASFGQLLQHVQWRPLREERLRLDLQQLPEVVLGTRGSGEVDLQRRPRDHRQAVICHSHMGKCQQLSYNVTIPLCLVELHTLDAAARRERSLFTSLTFCKVIISCSLRLNKRIHLYPFFCVSYLLESFAMINLR